MKKIIFSLILCLTFASAFSQLSLVNIGTAPNSGNGDNIRVAFGKSNANDEYLDARIDTLANETQSPLIQLTDIAAAADTFKIAVTTGSPLIGKNLAQLTATWVSNYGAATVTVKARRLRSGTWVDMTTSGATFAGESTSAAATINTANDDVLVGDRIYFISSIGAGTAPIGVQCTPTFQ